MASDTSCGSYMLMSHFYLYQPLDITGELCLWKMLFTNLDHVKISIWRGWVKAWWKRQSPCRARDTGRLPPEMPVPRCQPPAGSADVWVAKEDTAQPPDATLCSQRRSRERSASVMSVGPQRPVGLHCGRYRETVCSHASPTADEGPQPSALGAGRAGDWPGATGHTLGQHRGIHINPGMREDSPKEICPCVYVLICSTC